ncbi:MAG: lysylphosphatidylglycerol synthase transmembrane domain-containing protein [Salibacteraceae bacterium]
MHIKLLIAGLALGFIYYELFEKPGAEISWSEFQSALKQPGAWGLLLLSIALMPVNWGVESIKWLILAKKIQPFTFFRALGGVLSGVTVGIFTPNRTGEFAGRVLYLEPEHRVQGALINVIASWSQLLVTLLAGTTAFYLLNSNLTPGFNGQLFLFDYLTFASSWPIYWILGTLVASLALAYFRLPKLSGWLKRVGSLQKFHRYFRVFGYYRKRELIGVFLLSVLRYSIFVFQYWLVFRAMGVELPLFMGYLLIPFIYLGMTLLPTIALAEPGLRGAVAMGIVGDLYGSSVSVLLATLSIWAINLAVPALVGSLLLFRTRIFPTTPNE